MWLSAGGVLDIIGLSLITVVYCAVRYDVIHDFIDITVKFSNLTNMVY